MQDYNTIIGAIQMRLNKCPTRSVMDRFRIGSSTLNLIMSRYKALELTIDELEAMSPKEVENLFYPQKNLQRKEVPLPDFQYYYDRIHAPNSRVNISFCWLDYKEKNPDGYEKSQFYEYYQRFVQENYGGTKISMAVNRKPGEKMYIDWVGDQPGLLTDVTTGEIMRVHIFATTLGVSSMIYAEAFPNEKLPCFIEGCVHAVSFYGAVAKHFVPDNLKTAVTKHTKDDLVLQSTFSDLEDFYDTIVLPPPARKPKGKPTVENHVRYLETHLIEKLKEKIYTSFEDLNADIKKIVAVLNARPFQNQAFSRQEMFIKYDKPCMKPLPGEPIIDYKYQQSKDGLMEVSVPEMVIKLKQGIGRLIRSESDKGIVSIIDSRVGKTSKAPYKQIIWESLPIKSKTNKIEKIAAFYSQVVEQQKEEKQRERISFEERIVITGVLGRIYV